MSTPKTAKDWDARYQRAETPWETGRVDKHLRALVTSHPIAPCPALEIGCGNGNDSIWLASQGFEVTGRDWAETAIAEAKRRAARAGVDVDFAVGSFPDGRFGLLYDCGCFHTVEEPADRAAFARDVAARLSEGGLWISLIGSTDGPERDHGPPRMSALEVIAPVEPAFEILDLRSDFYDADLPSPARAWVLLARARSGGMQASGSA